MHGAQWLGEGKCRFSVWAPAFERVELYLVAPEERTIPLERGERGYHAATVDGLGPGARYKLRLGETAERPDPASRFQPEGSHGASAIVDLSFPWTDAAWRPIPLERYVISEIHIGTFSAEGTFDGAIPHLDGLRDLGVTAVEVMPVAQFPGSWNWGYDGTFPFAVHNTYGGPAGLQRFVDACHARGLAVVLDVVYNHMGPEGNYLWGAAPYFTERYKTPWGPAINFDGAGSDEVRAFFVENALQWVRDFHVDALRLDAVHEIIDASAKPFLEELGERVHAAGGLLIAESDRNDPRCVRPPARGGFGLDSVWNDDFHHSLRGQLTGETAGYYRDFGKLEQLGRAIAEGFVYTGQYSAFRGRRHGAPAPDIGGAQLCIFAQNHDQVGNRVLGERLSTLVPFEKLKLAAAVVLLSPQMPLLFMGEEYGETAPFPYFVSHTDPALIEAVRKGRREEFAKFSWTAEPPDPQSEETFESAKLDRSKGNGALREWYRKLLLLRSEPPFSTRTRESVRVTVDEDARVLHVYRTGGGASAWVVFNFSGATASVDSPEGSWRLALDSGSSLPDNPGTRLSLPPAGVGVYLR